MAKISRLMESEPEHGYKGGTGILKIGKTLGVGTGTVQRVLMEQPHPFEVDVVEAAFAAGFFSLATSKCRPVR